jgi:hypothetical protein
MELSKPDYLGGGWPINVGIIESGFAAHAQCSADPKNGNKETAGDASVV